MVTQLVAGSLPPELIDQVDALLIQPDRNRPEVKAFEAACEKTNESPAALLLRCGAFPDAYHWHFRRFAAERFPKGIGFPELPEPPTTADLPLADVQAVSIDDANTTEIDDALSVTHLPGIGWRIGVHIAAPGLGILPGSPHDAVARARLSTVYMPGHKITMLPDALVARFTLAEGKACPALSLYLNVSEDFEILSHESRIERVPIAANLRHDQLDHVVTQAWLDNPNFAHDTNVALPAMPREQLSFLFRLAQHLKAQREVVRGKPETFNRPDYNFRLVGNDGQAPQGHEQVEISVRQRGAPLDLMVAEAMILANSTWGQWLGELGVPAIYRSQASLQPGVKVRMGTKALPHAGIGVPSYAWSTSPLRRYTDLVNQWQIIACVKHGNTAALVAPFKPKDAQLLSIISAFDAAYTSYNAYQAGMERFWTLQYLQQHKITELPATVFKVFPGQPPMARADHLPLVLPVMGASDLPRGAQVLLRLSEIDDISLDISGQLLSVLNSADASSDASHDAQALDEDDDTSAGPIAIAVDVNEEQPAGTEATGA